MELFESIQEMGHEQVLFCQENDIGLRAIIAIHDTSLGPAVGATRLWPFVSEKDALQDALRLSRGMTYKAACANLPIGGGKAVIIAHPKEKTDRLLRAYGHFVERLKGCFITGQDVNISPQDLIEIRRETNHVIGISDKGGSVPATAKGVFLGIKAALKFRLNKNNFDGVKVAVQGIGNVGINLCQHLSNHGAKIFVSDLDAKKTENMQYFYNATVVPPNDIYSLDVDVFAPCALGGVINNSTIPQIKASIIAGAANNQLEHEILHSKMLKSKGILYCPDYVINAGGLINVYNEMIGYNEERAFQGIDNIYSTLIDLFTKAEDKEITPYEAAQSLAEERIATAKFKVNKLVRE
jgi:leucine dehydrogenase